MSAVLWPAFQWLLSKHTRRWKPFLLAHTVNEALFARTAAETQRAGPSGWSLCLLCTENTARNIKHIKPKWGKGVWCEDYLSQHANWNFLMVSEGARKWLVVQHWILHILKKAKKIDKITFLFTVWKTGDSTQSVFCVFRVAFMSTPVHEHNHTLVTSSCWESAFCSGPCSTA